MRSSNEDAKQMAFHLKEETYRQLRAPTDHLQESHDLRSQYTQEYTAVTVAKTQKDTLSGHL